MQTSRGPSLLSSRMHANSICFCSLAYCVASCSFGNSCLTTCCSLGISCTLTMLMTKSTMMISIMQHSLAWPASRQQQPLQNMLRLQLVVSHVLEGCLSRNDLRIGCLERAKPCCSFCVELVVHVFVCKLSLSTLLMPSLQQASTD